MFLFCKILQYNSSILKAFLEITSTSLPFLDICNFHAVRVQFSKKSNFKMRKSLTLQFPAFIYLNI